MRIRDVEAVGPRRRVTDAQAPHVGMHGAQELMPARTFTDYF